MKQRSAPPPSISCVRFSLFSSPVHVFIHICSRSWKVIFAQCNIWLSLLKQTQYGADLKGQIPRIRVHQLRAAEHKILVLVYTRYKPSGGNAGAALRPYTRPPCWELSHHEQLLIKGNQQNKSAFEFQVLLLHEGENTNFRDWKLNRSPLRLQCTRTGMENVEFEVGIWDVLAVREEIRETEL